MTEEYNFGKLLELLNELRISVFNSDGSARTEADLIDRLFHAYGKVYNRPDMAQKIIDALVWMQTGGNFTDKQNFALSFIQANTWHENKKAEKAAEEAAALEEANSAIDEFLDSFPIVGGDAV